MSDTRPLEVGETIALTDTVHSKSVVGLDLPANAKFANEDQRFDTFEVEILEEVRRTEAPPGNISSQLFRVRGEDGTETTVSYGGRSFLEIIRSRSRTRRALSSRGRGSVFRRSFLFCYSRRLQYLPLSESKGGWGYYIQVELGNNGNESSAVKGGSCGRETRAH